ncbi:hypothetical protein HN011_001625 [Eciton burchellii]|nr:hypothetical protein HN011_001625 [Eciton burchellii]
MLCDGAASSRESSRDSRFYATNNPHRLFGQIDGRLQRDIMRKNHADRGSLSLALYLCHFDATLELSLVTIARDSRTRRGMQADERPKFPSLNRNRGPSNYSSIKSVFPYDRRAMSHRVLHAHMRK